MSERAGRGGRYALLVVLLAFVPVAGLFTTSKIFFIQPTYV